MGDRWRAPRMERHDVETRRRLVEEALREGYSLSGGALKALECAENPLQLLQKVLSYIRSREPEALVVEERHLQAVGALPGKPLIQESAGQAVALEAAEEEAPEPELWVDERFLKPYRTEGKGEEFRRYFADRYERLRKLLEQRVGRTHSVSEAMRFKQGQELVLALMLVERRESEKAVILEAEDLTGSLRVVVPKRSQRLAEEAASILPDSVFGVRATRLDNALLAQELFLPDAPLGSKPEAPEAPEAYLCLTSDLHVGSKKFRRDLWESFLDWLSRGRDSEAKRVRYLIVAGDLVDGVGVFPGQRRELEYASVRRQLEEAVKLLKEIPGRVRLVLAPGNHDPVEKALPQPPMGGAYREILERAGERLTLVGNPAWLRLGGRRVLVYHGQSLDDIIQALPNVSYNTLREDVGKVLEAVVRHRHLAPIYGENTPILPLPEDMLVLEELPDLIHSGHIHVAYAGTYRGVTLINTGAWQEQTSYQKSMGLKPTVGTIALVNLKDMRVKLRRFC